MDRLTEINNYIGFMETYLNINCEECQYKNTEECEEYKGECKAVADFKCFVHSMYTKLKEYEDLEKQKQLIKLPCVVGDTVWYWDKDRYPLEDAPVEGYVSEYKIGSKNSILIIITPKRDFASWCFYDSRDTLFIENFGKTIFHTKEEADAALKSMNISNTN